MTKNTNCKHCIKNCKVLGKNECEKYKAISDRPNQLPNLIRESLNKGDYQEVEKLQKELFAFNHGF